VQQSVSEVEPVCVPFVPTRLQYRPALDGVRAFAVLAVIGYHLGYRWLRGGFVGVDVFFVLSGYLITTLLVLEYQRTARIDIPNFWLRRAKRLLPALFILIVAVWCWEVAEAPRFELPQRGQDLIWTLFYGSNWHFISSGQDYFAQFTSASPVRHTWSLAIEEQFYLAWPPIVLLILMRRAKTGSRLALVCAVGILASALAMAWLFAPDDPSRAYYGTDTRAHQLLIGALLAVLALSPRLQRATRLAAYASLLGAAVLLTAMIRLSDHDPRYWNGWSLALAVAAASLIWGLELNSVGPLARLLAWRPLVWIGQISYGLYLWHWPVIVAVKTGFRPLDIFPRSTGLNLTRLALTFGVATASFYLVEQPVKQGRVWWIASSRFRLAAAAIVATALVAGVVATTGIDATVVEDIPGCPSGTYRPCLRVQAPRSAAVVAVIGDSLARSLDPAFAALARENGWTYILGATNGCRISHLLTSSAGLSKAVNQQ